MTLLIDPLEGVPASLHNGLRPLLPIANKLARMIVERVATEHPLPWSWEFTAHAMSSTLRTISEELPKLFENLPDFTLQVINRQVAQSFLDRLDELYSASGSQPEGGRA